VITSLNLKYGLQLTAEEVNATECCRSNPSPEKKTNQIRASKATYAPHTHLCLCVCAYLLLPRESSISDPGNLLLPLCCPAGGVQ
jgi:hypothetical protein